MVVFTNSFNYGIDIVEIAKGGTTCSLKSSTEPKRGVTNLRIKVIMQNDHIECYRGFLRMFG